MAAAMATKALSPSANGVSRSAPVEIGPATTGSSIRLAWRDGVRPGAQEATSSARRRRRGDRRRAEPYTGPRYYLFVYLSRHRSSLEPERSISRVIIQRPFVHEDLPGSR